MMRLAIDSLNAIAYHLEKGEDNGGITRAALAEFLRDIADKEQARYLADMQTFDHETAIGKLESEVKELRAALQWIVDNNQCERLNGGDPEWFAERAPDGARKALGDW